MDTENSCTSTSSNSIFSRKGKETGEREGRVMEGRAMEGRATGGERETHTHREKERDGERQREREGIGKREWLSQFHQK